jgi:adenylate cyclase
MLDPSFGPAYAAMALIHILRGVAFAAAPLQECAKLATGWARKAIETDGNDAEAQAILAWASGMLGIREAARESIAFAYEINPNSPLVNAVAGMLKMFSCDPLGGRALCLTALRVNPLDPLNMIPLCQIAMSYYFQREYAKALEAARRVLSQYPDLPLMYQCVAASLGQLGRADEARDALQTAIDISPQSFDLIVHKRPPWFLQDDHEHYVDGLRKAGWQG